MNVSNLIAIIQIILSIALVVLVLIQQRGGGLGVLGGVNTQYYGTRRGLEKMVFIGTIIIGALFIALTLISFIFK